MGLHFYMLHDCVYGEGGEVKNNIKQMFISSCPVCF